MPESLSIVINFAPLLPLGYCITWGEVLRHSGATPPQKSCMPELTAKQLNRIAPKDAASKIDDTGGLYLDVLPAGLA